MGLEHMIGLSEKQNEKLMELAQQDDMSFKERTEAVKNFLKEILPGWIPLGIAVPIILSIMGNADTVRASDMGNVRRGEAVTLNVNTKDGGRLTDPEGEPVEVTFGRAKRSAGEFPEQSLAGGEPPRLENETRIIDITARVSGNPNFRSSPTTQEQNILGSLSAGAEIQVFGFVDRPGEGLWYHVRTGPGMQQTGWVNYQFVIGIDMSKIQIVTAPEVDQQPVASPPPVNAPTGVPSTESQTTVGAGVGSTATEGPIMVLTEVRSKYPYPQIPGFDGAFISIGVEGWWQLIQQEIDNGNPAFRVPSPEIVAQITALNANHSIGDHKYASVLTGIITVPGNSDPENYFPTTNYLQVFYIATPQRQGFLMTRTGDGGQRIPDFGGSTTPIRDMTAFNSAMSLAVGKNMWVDLTPFRDSNTSDPTVSELNAVREATIFEIEQAFAGLAPYAPTPVEDMAPGVPKNWVDYMTQDPGVLEGVELI